MQGAEDGHAGGHQAFVRAPQIACRRCRPWPRPGELFAHAGIDVAQRDGSGDCELRLKANSKRCRRAMGLWLPDCWGTAGAQVSAMPPKQTESLQCGSSRLVPLETCRWCCYHDRSFRLYQCFASRVGNEKQAGRGTQGAALRVTALVGISHLEANGKDLMGVRCGRSEAMSWDMVRSVRLPECYRKLTELLSMTARPSKQTAEMR